MQKSRTSLSSSAIRRGVNTRDIRLRCIVCTGGSSNSTTAGGISMSARMISRIGLRELENVRQFTNAFSTSAWRDNA